MVNEGYSGYSCDSTVPRVAVVKDAEAERNMKQEYEALEAAIVEGHTGCLVTAGLALRPKVLLRPEARRKLGL